MNETEILMLGLSRSGNHAIADWIFRQATAPKLMLNCAEGKTNPFASCRPLGDGPGWREDPEGLHASGSFGAHGERALLLHSYEDSWIGHAFSRELEVNHDAWLGPSYRRIALVVLRDPFNLFASRLKAGDAAPDRAVRIWKQHARAALGQVTPPGDFIPVLYNRWAAEPAYRQSLAASLGLTFSDAGADRVPDCRGGSSFDGTAFDGQATAMPTDRRWRAYADDPAYLRLFDEQLVAFSARLFGPPPALSALKPDVPREALGSGAG